MEGWIKLHRKLMDNPQYFSEPFCRNMAWVDLLMLANHTKKSFYKRGILVEINKGEIGYDVGTLGKRWRWSNGKVRRWFLTLETEGQIVWQKSNLTSIVSIVNYSNYQGGDTANDNANDIANGQQTVYQTDTNKNEKNEKNEKKEETISQKRRIEKIFNVYNKSRLPKATKLTPIRIKHINARIHDYSFETVLEVLQKASESNFLCGENDRGWCANLDWIFNPSNFNKILEGSYTNRKGVSKKNNNGYVEEGFLIDKPVIKM